MRIRLTLLFGALLAGVAGAEPPMDCPPERWPCAPLQVVSHAAPGGGTDVTIRHWLPAAQAAGGPELEVVYRQGGGARVAHEYLKARGPDGHTLLAVTETHLYTIARGQSPLRSIGALRGVARAMRDPSLILVAADGGPEDYAGLLAAGRQAPLVWGVAQIGGTEHIGIRRWAGKAGVRTRVMPFGGGADTVAALQAGAVDAILANVSEARPALASGAVRPLAVLQPERLPQLPGVPTVHELGHPVTVATTRGYAVHADTPEPLVRRLEAMVLAALESRRFQSHLRHTGLDPAGQVAGAAAWDAELRASYAEAERALRALQGR